MPRTSPSELHHLGDDEAAAAVPLDETAKRRVGHAGHRRDRERRSEVRRCRSSSVSVRLTSAASTSTLTA